MYTYIHIHIIIHATNNNITTTSLILRCATSSPSACWATRALATPHKHSNNKMMNT